ncbi:MAG TPA: hypothetical protein VEA40_27125 [Ramlibacter sp.]|nr:hypothetical protein [Ramlibacter sp.]
MQQGSTGDLVAELAKFGERSPESARLMGLAMALAGEVFVLKAQVERLTRALQAQGSLSPDALEAAGRSREMAAWMAAEEAAYAGSLAAPFLQPDLSVDATPWMRAD